MSESWEISICLINSCIQTEKASFPLRWRELYTMEQIVGSWKKYSQNPHGEFWKTGPFPTQPWVDFLELMWARSGSLGPPGSQTAGTPEGAEHLAGRAGGGMGVSLPLIRGQPPARVLTTQNLHFSPWSSSGMVHEGMWGPSWPQSVQAVYFTEKEKRTQRS